MDKNHKETPEAPQVDANRRRLTKAGLAAPAVLGALASRKVLAEAPWNCTVSGQISGNISRPGAVVCSTVGAGFSAYASVTSWPAPCSNYFETTGQGSCQTSQPLNFGEAPATLSTQFRDAFQMPTGESGNTKPATVLEVFTGASDLIPPSGKPSVTVEFGREALLALFNSYANPTSNPNGFPLSPGEVVAMFNAIYDSNAYNTGIPGAAPWNGATVLAYWKLLHP